MFSFMKQKRCYFCESKNIEIFYTHYICSLCNDKFKLFKLRFEEDDDTNISYFFYEALVDYILDNEKDKYKRLMKNNLSSSFLITKLNNIDKFYNKLKSEFIYNIIIDSIQTRLHGSSDVSIKV